MGSFGLEHILHKWEIAINKESRVILVEKNFKLAD